MKTSGYDREHDGGLAGWFTRWFLVGFVAAIAFGTCLMHIANERAEAGRPSLRQGTSLTSTSPR